MPEIVLMWLWRALKGKSRNKDSFYMRPRIRWFLPKNKWLPLRRNWKKPRNSKIKLKLRAKAEEAKVEAEKVRDEVEQYGYDVSVAETKDTIRAQVPAVCRTYCV